MEPRSPPPSDSRSDLSSPRREQQQQQQQQPSTSSPPLLSDLDDDEQQGRPPRRQPPPRQPPRWRSQEWQLSASDLQRAPRPSQLSPALTSPTSRRHSPARSAIVDEAAAAAAETPIRPASSLYSRRSVASSGYFPSLAIPDARSSRSDLTRRPSIRIRRSLVGLDQASSTAAPDRPPGPQPERAGQQHVGRPRSVSQPSSLQVPLDAAMPARNSRRLPQVALPRLTEEGTRPTLAELGVTGSPITPAVSLPDHTFSNRRALDDGSMLSPRKPSRLRRVRTFLWPSFARRGAGSATTPTSTAFPEPSPRDVEYDSDLVDWLDAIDPEVQALSTLTNVQNSLFIPDLGHWVNRRPTYTLSQQDLQQIAQISEARARVPEPRPEDLYEPDASADGQEQQPGIQRSNTITSRLTDSHYAALPPGRSIEGWSAAEKRELDDHVRHMLHSRRARFRRTMKGFGQYVRRPLGFFVTLYATLITLFGLAWVLFLIGWIYVGQQQVYAIHIIDSILVALFAIMGDGLAPFRAIDTYHLFFIVRYSRIIKNVGRPPRARLRKRNLPAEVEQAMENPVVTPTLSGRTEIDQQDWAVPPDTDTDAVLGPPVYPVEGEQRNEANDALVEEAKPLGKDLPIFDGLTAKQRGILAHHQKKIAKSHSFYKPEETFTHHSFPLSYLVAVIVLLDCHSCLQISLGACTWGIDYHVRPFALTTVILCVSITCNLTAGLVIMRGDHKTRKKEVLKLLDRQELTGDAMRRMEQRRRKKFTSSPRRWWPWGKRPDGGATSVAGGGDDGEQGEEEEEEEETVAAAAAAAASSGELRRS